MRLGYCSWGCIGKELFVFIGFVHDHIAHDNPSFGVDRKEWMDSGLNEDCYIGFCLTHLTWIIFIRLFVYMAIIAIVGSSKYIMK